jgi:predicted nucleic acid-binding protein
MIVADSSVLIEYFRRGGSGAAQEAVAAAIAKDLLAFNGIIFVEVVGFAADERERRALLATFTAFRRLVLDDADFELAASLGFELRRRGRTVPSTDLIIAACAIRAGAELLHVDDHFDEIAGVSALASRNPSKPSKPA